MKTIVIALITVAGIGFASAQTEKAAERRQTAIAKQEQTAAVATCRADWLRQGGVGSSSRAFFGHMAECLSRSAAR